MNEYMLTIWQPIMIRFGPVLADSRAEAYANYPEDHGVNIDAIERAINKCLPSGCWAEWSIEKPINTLVHRADDLGNDIMFDAEGNLVEFNT